MLAFMWNLLDWTLWIFADINGIYEFFELKIALIHKIIINHWNTIGSLTLSLPVMLLHQTLAICFCFIFYNIINTSVWTKVCQFQNYEMISYKKRIKQFIYNSGDWKEKINQVFVVCRLYKIAKKANS